MGLFSITGLEGVTGVLKDLIGLFPNAEQRERAASKIQDLELAIAQGQMAINAEEAKSPSLFVSGGRPAVAWICVAGVGYAFLVHPVAVVPLFLLFGYAPPPPPDVGVLVGIVTTLLGLGTLRTTEKVKGVPPSIPRRT